MHEIEPYYHWRHLYIAEEDDRSPFFGRTYSEFEFVNSVYNFCIHPQWDDFGSATLYIKILYVNYDEAFCIIEFIGEWNDILHNDIMYLKRNVLDVLLDCGINKFILIGEYVMNAHIDDNDYYQEWSDELLVGGWIVALNFRNHVLQEFKQSNISNYINFGSEMNEINWRKNNPIMLYNEVSNLIVRRLNF